jgi:hypothetical protein
VFARLAYYAYPSEQLRPGADGLSHPGRRVRDAVHAARAARGYDPELLASFLLLQREKGEALAFSVVERAGAGTRPPSAEPPDDVPYRLEEDELLEVSAARPPEGEVLYGALTRPQAREPQGEAVRMSFLLPDVRFTLTDAAEAHTDDVYELEYFFLRDQLIE